MFGFISTTENDTHGQEHPAMSVVLPQPAVQYGVPTFSRISTLKNKLKSALDELETRIQPWKNLNKNSLLLIGPSGAGKSTLATFLSGHVLVAEPRLDSLILCEHRTSASASTQDQVVIGHDARPATTVPNVVYVENPIPDVGLGDTFEKVEDLLIWDCPGFDSVCGINDDIVTAATISTILKYCAAIKILVVLPEDSVRSNRGLEVIELFNRLTNLFPNTEELSRMTSLIISKKNLERQPLAYLDLYINEITNTLTPKSRHLLSYLRQNRQIVYFPEPKAVGAYHLCPAEMWSEIFRNGYVNQPDFQFSAMLSFDAKNELEQFSFELNTTVAKMLKDSQSTLVFAFKQTCHELSNQPDDLRQYITTTMTTLRSLTTTAPVLPPLTPIQRRQQMLKYSQITGLTPAVAEYIATNIEHIETLMFISGVKSESGSSESRIKIDYHQREWASALGETKQRIEDLANHEFSRLKYQEELRTAEALLFEKQNCFEKLQMLYEQCKQDLETALKTNEDHKTTIEGLERELEATQSLVDVREKECDLAQQLADQKERARAIAQALADQREQELKAPQYLAQKRQEEQESERQRQAQLAAEKKQQQEYEVECKRQEQLVAQERQKQINADNAMCNFNPDLVNTNEVLQIDTEFKGIIPKSMIDNAYKLQRLKGNRDVARSLGFSPQSAKDFIERFRLDYNKYWWVWQLHKRYSEHMNGGSLQNF